MKEFFFWRQGVFLGASSYAGVPKSDSCPPNPSIDEVLEKTCQDSLSWVRFAHDAPIACFEGLNFSLLGVVDLIMFEVIFLCVRRFTRI